MDKNINELFWNADLNQMKTGYIQEEGGYTCILCGERFEEGQIYPLEDKWYDAKKRMELHIKENHESVLAYILQMNTNVVGITEVQNTVLQQLAQGKSDKEVAEHMGIHPSTVRNHKYRLREKEKQAKLFLTMMALLEENSTKPITEIGETSLSAVPKTATMVDDRYDLTDTEKEKVIKSYFDETGRLKNYPAKEKRKIIVLEQIASGFKKGKFYTELEINRVLQRTWEDHVALRRALIEYGFMERAADGKTYWIKE